jgi:prolyl-tRNA editing enzyme YbaK/EbsC (Cys-tRNA(Pro) deacylase)
MDTTQSLHKSAQKVQDILAKKGITTRVVELPDSTRTAQDAASAIGCKIEQIIKSLIFKTKETDQPILILASGPNRINEKAIENYVGEKIVKADAEYTRKVTGFAIGGIPPVGHQQDIKTFIDEDLLAFEDLWAAAGTPNAVFTLKASDLIHLTNGTIVSVK